MATAAPNPPPNLDISEQVARIDKTQAELQKIFAETLKVQLDSKKVQQDTKFAPFTLVFTGIGAGAAIFAAGGAFFKLLVG